MKEACEAEYSGGSVVKGTEIISTPKNVGAQVQSSPECSKLDVKIRELVDVASKQGLRPFVCGGHPGDCSVFIVGTNPATPMEEAFSEYWSEDSGFDKARWFRDYTLGRTSKGKPPLSNTRERIERIVDAASPALVLETNVYAKATARQAELNKAERVSAPFCALYELFNPGVLIVHGKEACQEVGRILSVPLQPRPDFENSRVRDGCTLVAVPHLRFMKYERAVALGKYVRSVVAKQEETT
jgi:hypothetical protein